MEYKILREQSIFSCTRAIEALTRAVNEAISQGWEPLGGIALGDAGVVMQAMIKRR